MAKLVLCKGVELEPNYEHTFDFANATEQGEYFLSKAYKTYPTFLKIKDRNASLFKGIIAKENYDYLKVDDILENVRECTYLYWEDDETSKIYYAFITNSYYINEKCTALEYELDVMQTFLFDYHIESAYIAREHQDRMYKNTSDNKYYPIYNIQPEELNLGKDYYIENFQQLSSFKDTGDLPLLWLIIVASGKLMFLPDSSYEVSRYDTSRNLSIYVIPFIASGADTTNTREVYFKYGNAYTPVPSPTDVSQLFSEDPNIYQMYIMPHLPFEDKLTISRTTIPNVTGTRVLIEQPITSVIITPIQLNSTPAVYMYQFNQTFTVPTNRGETKIGTIDAIKNITIIPSTTLSNSISYETKLYTHPYRKMELQVDNASGELYYEYAKSNDMYGIFNFYATTNQLYYNKYYNQPTDKLSYGLRHNIVSKSVNDVPLATSKYLEYILTKNAQVQTGLAVKTAGTALTTLVAGAGAMAGAINPVLAVGAIGASLVGTLGAVAEEAYKREDLKNVPDDVKSMGNDGLFGSISFSCVPFIYYLSIREEYLKQAYSYFRLFGYKANRLATPTYNGQGTITSDNMNLKSRYYYNYIKCADINIELGYNRDYHDKIVAIFKNGITFWHYRNATMTASTFKPFNYRYENIEVSLLN